MTKLDKAYETALDAAGGLPKTVHGLSVDGDYIGTCQACFNQYVVKQAKSAYSKAGSDTGSMRLKSLPKGKLVVVLHGYERPGHGYVQGECPGRGHEPFEVAKDVTELFRKRLSTMLVGKRAGLVNLKGGKVKKLTVEVDDKTAPSRNTWDKRPKKWITIEPGWVNPDSHYDDWNARLKNRIWKTEEMIKEIEGDLKFIDMMLGKWKYDPQALINTKGKKIGVRAVDQEAAQSKQGERLAARDAKEKKAQAVLDSYLASTELVAHAKKEPLMIANRVAGWGYIPSPDGETMYGYIMKRYVEPAKKETNQVHRIELLKYAYGSFRDLAERARPPIKIKVPRG